MNRRADDIPLQPDLPILRVEQAAELAGISRTTMFALLERGEIRSMQVGRARRIPVSAIREWIERKLQENDEKGRTTQ